MPQKLVPDFSLILASNSKQPLHARNLFKILYSERGLSKSLKEITLFFLSNPFPFNKQSYQKQNGPGSCGQSLLHIYIHMNIYIRVRLKGLWFVNNDGLLDFHNCILCLKKHIKCQSIFVSHLTVNLRFWQI